MIYNEIGRINKDDQSFSYEKIFAKKCDFGIGEHWIYGKISPLPKRI
jgi:hypothetical protein